MSLFGAMNTAISGLNSQSAAFSNISENVANSQTVGFKRVDTAFKDILTQSTAITNQSGSTIALPSYQNNIQGTISQTDNPLALAISGQGFFPVSTPLSVNTSGTPTFSTTQAYTRAGDFQMNQQGYLVNSAGSYLNGWTVDPSTGVANTNSLVPIQITQNTYNPVSTSNIDLSANLPADPTIDATTNLADPVTSQVTVYDAVGTAHAVTLSWSQVAASGTSGTTTTPQPNTWVLTITAAGDTTTPAANNQALVTFGNISDSSGTVTTSAPSGTISSVSPYNDPTTGATSTATTSTTYNTNLPATVQFSANFGDGPQTINLNLGIVPRQHQWHRFEVVI